MNIKTIGKGVNLKEQNIIISKIRDLINYKNLEPRDKLPSERRLSEEFGVTRSNVREAIQKLEFYGLLNSVPQSGTFVSNIGVIAMNGMIDDILRLEKQDFKTILETRILLELKTASLAAIRRTDKDLVNMKTVLNSYSEKLKNGQDAVQEDLLFHLAIAKASGNSTINTFMLMITPEIITNIETNHSSKKGFLFSGIAEYLAIYDAIEEQNPQLAKQKMKEHFNLLYENGFNN